MREGGKRWEARHYIIVWRLTATSSLSLQDSGDENEKSKNHWREGREDRISQTAGTACRLNLNDLLLHRKLIIVILAVPGNIAQNWIYISIVGNDAPGRVVTAAQLELWSLFSIFGTEQARDNDWNPPGCQRYKWLSALITEYSHSMLLLVK